MLIPEAKVEAKDISLNDIQALYRCYEDDINEAIRDVLASGKFINGPWVKDFAARLAELSQCAFAIPCANGTDALQIALMALDLPAGSEIITSVYSFASAAEASTLLGLQPVFVDIDLDDFNMSLDQIESAISDKTKVIIPIHLFGSGVEMERLMLMAAEHDITVIEDNAQSFGTMQNGKWLGSYGHMSTTSFFPTKNLGCFGDGGAVMTSDSDLARACTAIARHGTTRKYHHDLVGINSRLDSVQAAILMEVMAHLPKHISNRQAAARRYHKLLGSIDEVSLPTIHDGHTFNQYVILTKGRDKLQAHLKSCGISTTIYYPECLHIQPAFTGAQTTQSFPNAEQAASHSLALPMHPFLPEHDQQYIAKSISEFYATKSQF